MIRELAKASGGAPVVRAIKEIVTVKPGGLIELRHPDLHAGDSVEVIVMREDGVSTVPPLGSLIGKVKACFANGEEADRFLRAERDAWDD